MVRVSTPSFASFVAAAMPQHVRVDLHVKARCASRAFDHGLEAAFCVVEPDSLLLCGGAGLLEPIARANSGAPETAAVRMTAASKAVLCMVPPVLPAKFGGL